ncbi:BZ3500_MvSof-1268-A1-R1_Chr10-1g02637 [Microbotryum saponariae]|uniref:BZ3500_MvSof-1268-A1-R1_Chr10-1g02637 protein n=1 Tax=Microbotryum saponariae TaxID=289078 RepID=A0A2X0NJT4_9BASI|nr:BZ3500_MvSof-1268-A1-R1_Chr10-1g02637 [Microbotryum saponariae]SDA06126.1 BZ3501_MvSof-1269-A2-R1_Chr10-1g02238 [Microbotryum saponariae]
MTTTQPILVLRHIYEPAVQLCRTDSVSTGHFSTCCSQGKGGYLPLPSPIPSIEIYLKARIAAKAKAFRENARSYNNALSFPSLAAHWNQTQVGTLGPPVFRVLCQTWLIDPAEAIDTRLGRDGADSRIQRSTLTKFESILRTGNCFVREFASAKARAGWDTAKEWILRLYLPPGRDRRTHNLLTSSTEMAMLICNSDTNTGDRGPQDLILQVHGDRCPDGRPKYQVGKMTSTPTFLFAGSTKSGRPSPETESRSTMVSNCARYLPVSVWMTKTKRRTKTATMRMKTARKVKVNHEDQGEGLEVDQPESCVPNSLHTTFTNAATISQSRVPPGVSFSRFVIDGYSQVETDRLNSIRLHQENLRLTTAQGIAEAVANSLTPDQMGRYQGTMACVVKYEKPSLFITVTCIPGRPEIQAALGPKDQACNRPDLIARVFEAKLNRLCDDGNKQGAGCFGAAETEDGMAPDLISPVYLHSINPSGDFPAHHLRLKEGIPVVLLRNLDPDAGLCNGTCLIVLHARSQVIPAIILTGD